MADVVKEVVVVFEVCKIADKPPCPEVCPVILSLREGERGDDDEGEKVMVVGVGCGCWSETDVIISGVGSIV